MRWGRKQRGERPASMGKVERRIAGMETSLLWEAFDIETMRLGRVVGEWRRGAEAPEEVERCLDILAVYCAELRSRGL